MRCVSVRQKLVVTLVGLASLAGAALLSLGFGDARPANAASQPIASANLAAAQTAAARILGDVPVPVGATEVSIDPGVSTWLKYSVAGARATQELVDLHRFWRVPGQPQTAIGWVKAHRPAGSVVSSTGTGGQYGTTVMWSVTFAFPAVPGQVSEEGLGVAVTAARGGGTAMRVDAFAIWLVPRAATEVVPAGTRVLRVFVDHFDHHVFPVSTIEARWKIRQLVAFIDSRQIEQPRTATSCPALGGDSPLLDLRFMSASGTTPLARAVEDGCGGLSFWIHARSQPGLAEGADLTEMLWRLGALPICRAVQLSASATAPIRLPAPPSTVAQIIFRNVSSTTCALKGFARLRLRDASGRRLPTRVKNSTDPPHPVVLTPRASAAIGLEWPIPTHSCKAPRVASVDVTLPGQTETFTLPVGSVNHQFAPCNGIVRADAIG